MNWSYQESLRQYTSTVTNGCTFNNSGIGGYTPNDGSLEVLGTIVNVASIFAIGGIQAKAQANAQAQAAIAQAGTTTSGLINTYIQADFALDSSKQKMKSAMEEYNKLNTELTEAQDAETAKTNGTLNKPIDDLNTKVHADDNKEMINKYNDLAKAYKKASDDYSTYTKLGQENRDLETQKPSLNPADFKITKDGASVKINKPADAAIGDDNNTEFVGDGRDSSRISGLSFTVKDKEGNAVNDPGARARATARAQALDEAFTQKEKDASAYTKIQTKINSNTATMEALKAQNKDYKFDNGGPTEDMFTNGGHSLTDLKNTKLGNSGHTIGTYSTTLKNLQDDKAKKERIGNDTYIKSLETKIKTKKELISGSLKTDLEAKQLAFDNAKAAVETISTQASTYNNTHSKLDEYKAAADASKSNKKKFLGIRFGKKTQQQKDYKNAKKLDAQNQMESRMSYGLNSDALSQAIKVAQARVDAVNIDLPDDYKTL